MSGHTEGTPTPKGPKRWGGGLEIAKDRQEENQEKHPWCPVEGRGGEQAGLLVQSTIACYWGLT